MTAIDTSMRVDSPDISQMMNLQTSPLLNVQAPTFSPVGLPRPGKQADELWSSREVSFLVHVTDTFAYLRRIFRYHATASAGNQVCKLQFMQQFLLHPGIIRR